MDGRGPWYIPLLHLYITFIGIEAVCPPSWFGHSTVPRLCYKATNLSDSYNKKQRFCENEGGHLASIHSVDENNIIVSLFQFGDQPYLIGLTDRSHEGKWLYSDSTQVNFFNWDEKEPNNAQNEDCVMIRANGKWNDIRCRSEGKGICRRGSSCKVPEINRGVLRVYPVIELYHNGTYINYVCPEGYTVNGPSRAMCLRAGWVPKNTPSCKAKPCDAPFINGNEIKISNVTEYKNGSSIDYYCAEGYAINGSSSAVCLYGEWIPPTLPVCEAKTCAIPNTSQSPLEINIITQEYENGSLVSNGSLVDFYCAEGYIIRGISRAVCLHGKWVPPTLPVCEAKPCDAPLIYGTEIKISIVTEAYKNGSSVDYYCAKGYAIKGSSSAVCLYGEWIPPTLPECEALTQEDSKADLPLIAAICILILLIVIASACIFTYKLKTVLKPHRSLQTNFESNEDFPMSYYNIPMLQCADGFALNELDILKRIDTGMFGPIYKATAVGLFQQEQETAVLMVSLAENSTEDDKKQFRSMVEAYASLELHPHIVSFYTYSFELDKMFLLLEYPTGGNLKEYLQSISWSSNQRLLDSDLITFALQVVMGLDFISSKNCVHMNLKASKIVLSHDTVCKIYDFRPMDYTSASNIYITLSENRPSAKWMAPETIRFNILTTKSNVWSFGVVLWEIMTSGLTPYEGMDNKEVLEFVTAGCKLPRPQKNGFDMYATMMKCWTMNAADRPDFHDLRLELEKTLQCCDEYDAVDEDPEYGNATVFRR